MNRTKIAIVETFWELLEEKPYNKITVQDIVDHCHVNRNTVYYHFHDIPSLAEWSVEEWTDEVILNRKVFDSLSHCIIYMAEECTKRKHALLHLFRSANKDYFLTYLNKMGYHIIRSYVGNRLGELDLEESKPEIFVRYYKCTFMGIILDWLEDGASYDLVEFAKDFCEMFSGTGEKALLKIKEQKSL